MKTPLELLADRKNTTALELALDNYEMWYNASIDLASSKDYEISSGQGSKRKLSRADLDEVTNALDFWEREIGKITGDSALSPKVRAIFTRNLRQ